MSQAFVLSAVGHVAVAVPAQTARQVDLQDDTSTPLDVAEIFGLRVPRTGRRVVQVDTPSGPALLLLGDELRIERVDAEAIQPLPKFIEGLGARIAATHVALIGDAFHLVLDPTRATTALRRPNESP